MPTVRETFEAMPSRFRPERAQGVSATIQYEITGEGGGRWCATIANGSCALAEGTAPSPTLTVTMAAQDWLDLTQGKLAGQAAFLSGKLKLKGDMSLALRLPGLFAL